ncbi:hypothetical protein Syun_005819 [Stephania yunnanensis]|uniref:Pentatricopeptide repeat-containing protein n=1 Tax=Stephania yunnanensis TaxID=152371 RepID=A0AAP0KVH1_9MAGN
MTKTQKLKTISPFRLSSLLRSSTDPTTALRLFQNPNPNSPKPFRRSLLSYDLIITKLGRAELFDQMEQVLDLLRLEIRIAPKEPIFCNVIRYYGRSRLPQQALETFRRIPSFRCERTVRSLNALLNALIECRKYDYIREIYIEIDRYAAPDACTYNVLIKGACRNGCFDDALCLFDEMVEKGIAPNEVTFATLVSALCAEFRVDEALRLKEDMVEVFCLRPNVFLYTSLIKGFCEVGRLESALRVKEEALLDKELGVDSAIYSTLIRAFFKCGRKKEAFEVWEEMSGSGIEIGTVAYNAMISGFCDGKDFESAFGMLEEMVEKGLKPDVISFNVIIGGLCRDGKLREAIDLFEDMPRRGCVPDVVTFRVLFDGVYESMEIEEVMLILDEMVFKGFVPRIESVNKFVNRLCCNGNAEVLESVLGCLTKGNIINAETWQMVTMMACKSTALSPSFGLLEVLDSK